MHTARHQAFEQEIHLVQRRLKLHRVLDCEQLPRLRIGLNRPRKLQRQLLARRKSTQRRVEQDDEQQQRACARCW